MFKGLLIALLSMALWGLIFVLPLFTPQFSSFEIVMGRFVSYGLVSLLYIVFKGNLRTLPLKYWKEAVLFALSSSLVYYFCIVIGIRCLGASFATALCSFLPVLLSICGNFRNKVCPWRSLVLPLSSLALGLFLMHCGNMSISADHDKKIFLIGVLAIFSALAMWAWYSINNGEFLSRNPQIPSPLWSSFIGIICLFGGVVGLGTIFLVAPETCYLPIASKSELLTYLFAAFINGFLASWMTLFLWNRASRLVPMAILGQMGVFEVLFGLLYYYLIIGTLPTLYEITGVAFILTGLFFSFRRFLSPATKQVT